MESTDERWDTFLEAHQRVIDRLKEAEKHLGDVHYYAPKDLQADIREFLGLEDEEDGQN